MRILWIGNAASVWSQGTSWQTLEDFGIKVLRLESAAQAIAPMNELDFDALVVEAENDEALVLAAKNKKRMRANERYFIVVSSSWTKENFKTHSKTPGGAQRYARLPVPAEAFLGMLAELCGVGIDELKDYESEPVKEEKEEAQKAAPTKELEPIEAAASVSSPALEELLQNVPAAVERTNPSIRRRPGLSAGASEDIETLRKYVRLQEEELAIAVAAREELALENARLSKESQEQAKRVHELGHEKEEAERKAKNLEEEKESLQSEFRSFREQAKENERNYEEQIKALHSKVRDATEKYENLKIRVRKDIRKIRTNEKDLEARLELLRKDSETLLSARDQRVLELQRKIDALEFDLDQVQDSRVQAELESERYLAKLSRVARALNIANALLDDEHASEEGLDELEPLLGGAAAPQSEGNTSIAAPVSGPHAPMAAEAPVPEALGNELSQVIPEGEALMDLEALANDGEPTRVIKTDGSDDPNQANG